MLNSFIFRGFSVIFALKLTKIMNLILFLYIPMSQFFLNQNYKVIAYTEKL